MTTRLVSIRLSHENPPDRVKRMSLSPSNCSVKVGGENGEPRLHVEVREFANSRPLHSIFSLYSYSGQERRRWNVHETTNGKMGSRIAAAREALRQKAHQKKENASTAFKSWEDFKRWIEVPVTALDEHSKSNITWSNVDLDPTPPERRNWKAWNYFVFYWVISNSFPFLMNCILPFSDDRLRQLDIGLNNDWYWLELVAEYFDYFHQPADQLACGRSTR